MRVEMRLALWLVAALLLAGAAAAGAEWLLRGGRVAPGARVAVALLPAAACVPLVAMLTRAVRHQDEYWRRVQLVALAIAFGGTSVAAVALTALELAGLTTPWSLRAVFPLMAALYVVGLVVAWWRYR